MHKAVDPCMDGRVGTLLLMYFPSTPQGLDYWRPDMTNTWTQYATYTHKLSVINVQGIKNTSAEYHGM